MNNLNVQMTSMALRITVKKRNKYLMDGADKNAT